MFKPINGWTKEAMKRQFRERNTGKKCAAPGSWMGCMYDDRRGNHCAIGVFIPDGHPAMGAEVDASDLLDRYPDLLPLMPLESNPLLCLQYVHDQAYPDEDIHKLVCEWIDCNVEPSEVTRHD